MITKGHDVGELLVLKEGDEIAALALGAPRAIDIFEAKRRGTKRRRWSAR